MEWTNGTEGFFPLYIGMNAKLLAILNMNIWGVRRPFEVAIVDCQGKCSGK